MELSSALRGVSIYVLSLSYLDSTKNALILMKLQRSVFPFVQICSISNLAIPTFTYKSSIQGLPPRWAATPTSYSEQGVGGIAT